MAKSGKQVLGFLDDLAKRCRPAARREFAELEEFAGRKLQAWDLAYFSERLQESRFKVSQEALRPYFPLPKVLSGLFTVTERLYGITVRERPGVGRMAPELCATTTSRIATVESSPGSTWIPTRAPRSAAARGWTNASSPNRCPRATPCPWRSSCATSRRRSARQPSLLTHDEVTTLFHEFGHGLHHMLTRVPYPSIAGINGVAWDAVELPSQFMENFVWRAEVLPLISAHVVSGEPLPRRHAEASARHPHVQCGARHPAADRARQLRFRAARELRPARRARKSRETLEDVRRRVAVAPAAPFNRMPASFSHIFAGGYAAGYYSYKWAEVLAADAFEAFEQAGVFDSATAARFRRLDPGARRQPGRDGRVRALSRPPARRAAAAQANRNRRMRRGAAPALVLAAASLVFAVCRVRAATAYVSDELVLGVYTEQNSKGQRLATLHSGARVETLPVSGDFTQVRLTDGTTGWVKSSVSHHPGARGGACQTAPGGAGSQPRDDAGAGRSGGASSEMERRKRELADKQAQLKDKQAELDAALRRPVRSAAGAPAVRTAHARCGGTLARPRPWPPVRSGSGWVHHTGAARAAQVRRPESLLTAFDISRL